MEGSKPEKALQCYERALGWAGVSGNKPGGVADPGEGISRRNGRCFGRIMYELGMLFVEGRQNHEVTRIPWDTLGKTIGNQQSLERRF